MTRHIRRWLAAAAVAAVVAAAGGCGAQHRGEPQAPPVEPTSASEARGAALFQRHCYQCHPGGEAGLGPSLNEKPLPRLAIRVQIRKGVGAMPSFGADVLSDADVVAIADYVHRLHKAR